MPVTDGLRSTEGAGPAYLLSFSSTQPEVIDSKLINDFQIYLRLLKKDFEDFV
jgi:hypothetical protein